MTSAHREACYGGTRGTGERRNSRAHWRHESNRMLLSASGVLKFSSQQVFKITNLLAQKIQLPRQALNINSGSAIDVKIKLATQAVFSVNRRAAVDIQGLS